MPPEARGEGAEAWPAALERRVAEREVRIRRAHEVAAEAVTVPAAERQAWVASQPDCLCPEFVELMIAMAREHRGEEPRESVRFAHLAVSAIEAYIRIGAEDGDDVRALAWAELGNAHRINGDLRSAGTCFGLARQRLRHVADPLARVEVLSLEASYHDNRREFEEAERLLRRAERLARRYGGDQLLGKLQLQRAEAVRCVGRVVEAIDILYSALRLINPRTEPNMALGGLHNLAHYLMLAGDPVAGLKMFRRLRPAYLVFADQKLSARRCWLEAKACIQLGETSIGEEMLERARAKLAQQGMLYEVTLIGLDLAELLADTGRWAEVESLAEETLELCRGIGVTTETIAAATLLVEAAARRQAGAKEALALLETLRQALTPRDGIALS